ncbi:phosphoribosylaminoimidazolesuccinocarboxamide synthase [Halomarina salina]|uniref:Phosphoribosylaminoimidazole-succinocarboxamide synthase n=1 Tax=Halomarina salina TaxID=1872699 RepID=A0ABD5RQ72_9EURY|nr:phosphoribosylaminoimidazolesuccinocarboxamide synthase [Halomarina salina]
MTSVKEFRVEEAATADSLGRGSFVFTDAYSVFDWGQMPDPIPGKGRALCAMGAANFELLDAEGVPTHYRGVVPDDGEEPVPLADVDDPPREMAIDLTQVPDLPHEGRTYDYDAYHHDAGENYLVPLEIVFRNRVPVGSSLRSRTTPEAVGLDGGTWPEEAVTLPEPLVEFSTKYEESDRYLAREEADRIAGAASVDALESVARRVNELVTDRAAERGFTHEDGKIECLFYEGEVRVADVVGTFDENRFAYDGQQVSKEVVRQYHKRTQPEWVEAVAAAKEEAKERDVADWRELCERDPEPLDERVIRVVSDYYCAGANRYLGRDLFDAPSMDEAVAAVRDL